MGNPANCFTNFNTCSSGLSLLTAKQWSFFTKVLKRKQIKLNKLEYTTFP